MDFRSEKKFWKAETETFPTIPPNAMYVERVESYFDFRPLRHASTYIALNGMVGKVSSPAFQNFFRIENLLIIKKVMSKNVMNPYSIFWSVCYVCRSMSKGSKGSKVILTFDPFDMLQHT